MQYHVYILLCKDGSYYTGYTKDLESRLEQHMLGKGARYTRMHKPEKLVYLEAFATRREAMIRERQIKRLTHDEKLKLASSHVK
ncbi:GIY-YIG nuclease family protein [Candidatus Bathyarchaeota archaeon]|nr:MAG: GIY-YIG nuclease family protein [Candidatus Bathyarchaeota archaeon]